MTVAVFVFSLLGAMAIGMPIAYSLLVCGLALMGYLTMTGILPAFDSQILSQRFVDGADNFPLLAVPFFLLAGEFMNAGGLSRHRWRIGRVCDAIRARHCQEIKLARANQRQHR